MYSNLAWYLVSWKMLHNSLAPNKLRLAQVRVLLFPILAQLLYLHIILYSLYLVCITSYLYPKNLPSVFQICVDNHAFVEFHPHCFHVKNEANHQVLLTGHLEHGIYKVSSLVSHNSSSLFHLFLPLYWIQTCGILVWG